MSQFSRLPWQYQHTLSVPDGPYPHLTSCEGLPKEIPYIITYDDPRLVILAIANEGFGRS
jgi:hypothetical protein